VIVADVAKTAAHDAAKDGKWAECVAHATKAIEVGPNSGELRELRATCNTELGEAESAYADLSRLAMLRPSSEDLRLRLANLGYYLLDTTIALNEIKKCLHYDPESKACKKMHKLLRSLDRDTVKARNFIDGGNPRKGLTILRGEGGVLERFDAAMTDAEASGQLPPQFSASTKSQTRLDLYTLACRAAVDCNDFGPKSAALCDAVLALDPDNEHALVFRGERLLKAEKWEEAVNVLQKAFEQSGRSSQDIANRMQKAQRLLKVSKQKDYYKVLGVSRDADERTIKKAFRKAAKTNHPDVGGSEEKMAQLNEAYEVLSDSELRARFDNGEDPNDPQGGGQGGNPFAHHGGMPHFFQQGGFPGGFPGGGQKFQFHHG
jgi:DnaJ family protein C protein 3